MTLLELIDKWQLNRRQLAAQMGMKPGTFNNKLKEVGQYHKLTEAERDKLIGILKELASDIETATQLDFNDALARIVRQDA